MEHLFTLNRNKFRMIYKVDGNPQLDTCDSSMYSNILKLNISGFRAKSTYTLANTVNVIYFSMLMFKRFDYGIKACMRGKIFIYSDTQFAG